jgi:hypothetical protein
MTNATGSFVSARTSAPVPITSLLEYWDSSDIFDGELRYRTEEDEETMVKLKSGELTKDQVEKDIWEDQDLWDMRYEDMCMNITPYLNKISPNGYFKATVHNFGWLNRDGHKYFKAINGRELLREILPNTDCTYYIYKVAHGKKLAITNAHHDQPVLNKEWYIITPCSLKTYEQSNGR